MVMVEDHVCHISELLRTIQVSSPELSSNLTIVCLDRCGTDTDEAIHEWLAWCPTLQVAARVLEHARFQDHRHRVQILTDDFFQDSCVYCKHVAQLLRQRGLLVQDIELETLEFVPRDRWWQSTMLASTVRGIVGQRTPHCAFVSNKRGYEATFGAELLAAGHDPRDVMNKSDLDRVVVPFLSKFLKKEFPWELRGTSHVGLRLTTDEAERKEVEAEYDLVLWPARDGVSELGGRALNLRKKRRLPLEVDSNEYQTWRALILARLESRDGVEVVQVGERMAPSGALRAEVTNAAARHLHSLRKRLSDTQGVLTARGRYRLREDFNVGCVHQSW